jgi:thioredoxin reductase
MTAEKVVVIGAGPAGLAAAEQLNLYGISPLVFEKDQPGGLLLNANSVKNYPGVPEGTSGRELIKLFPLPEKLDFQRVTSVKREGSVYQVDLSDTYSVTSSAIIVASGTIPRKISVQCTSDTQILYDVKNIRNTTGDTVAVIGGGDAALDYALSLSSKFSVTVYARGNFSGAVPHLLASVKQIGRITLRPETPDRTLFPEKTIVVAAGRIPALDFVSGELLSAPPGDGSFHLCGDCSNGVFRQTAIAVGNGVEAAMKTAAYLRKLSAVR